MKEVIRFSLMKRFFNKNTLVFNILLVIVLALAVNIDFLIAERKTVSTIYIDDSVMEYRQDLLSCIHDDFEYVISNENYDEESAVLHKGRDGWKLYSREPLNERMREEIEKDVQKAIGSYFYRGTDIKTRSILDNYRLLTVEPVYEHVDESKSSSTLPVVSLIYFLVLSYAGSLSGEYLYEKNSRTLSLTLSSISTSQYFHGKLLSSLLIFIMQGSSTAVVSVVLLFIRYRIDRFTGLLRWLDSMDLMKNASDISQLRLSMSAVLLSGFIILMGLIIIQAFLLITCSSFRNNEDIAGFQNIFYLVLMVLYYLSLLYGDDSVYLGTTGGILSFLPVTQMIFMPCRLLLGDADIMQGAIALAVSVMFFLAIRGYLSSMLKRNLSS